jgi:putative transposase
MDGRGAWRDNVIVERLWRSVKYEEVYLRAYGAVSEARGSIGRYLSFYNTERPHSSLGYATPVAFAAELEKQRAGLNPPVASTALLRDNKGRSLVAAG